MAANPERLPAADYLVPVNAAVKQVEVNLVPEIDRDESLLSGLA